MRFSGDEVGQWMMASALAGVLGSQQAAEEIEPQDKKAYSGPSLLALGLPCPGIQFIGNGVLG